MDGDRPAGGRWNFDARQPRAATEGRASWPDRPSTTARRPRPRRCSPSCPARAGVTRPTARGPPRGRVPCAASTTSSTGCCRCSVPTRTPCCRRTGTWPTPLLSPYLNLGLLAAEGGRATRPRPPSGRATCRSRRPRGSSARSSAGGSTCGAGTGSGCPSTADATSSPPTARSRRSSPGPPPRCAASATSSTTSPTTAGRTTSQRLMILGNLRLARRGATPGS